MRHMVRWSMAAALAASVGCGPSSETGPVDPANDKSSFEREERGGRVHTQAVASFNVMDEKVAAELFETAQKNTGEALKGLSFGDFRVSDTSSELSAGGSVLNHVTMQQVVNNVPVYGTYVNVSARAQDTRGDARLVASAHHVYHGVNTNTTPTLKDTDAKAKVRQALGKIDAELGPAKLMLYPTRS